MTVKEPTCTIDNGGDQKVDIDPSKLNSDTTSKISYGETMVMDQRVEENKIQSSSQSGPIVCNKPTTVTLYASQDLEAAGLIPGLHDLINEAFAFSHGRTRALPAEDLRLKSKDQLVRELSGPGTFTFVVTYTGTNAVIGVASAKKYKSTPSRQAARVEDPKSAFTRTGPSQPDTEGWELSSMAVDPSLQRQGLAGLLMDLVDGEVKRRFLLFREEQGRPELRLVMLLTTVKEINGQFYARRGWRADYETFQGPGWHGSENGFTVVHMSKQVDA